MANLNSHETGNGGHSQGDTYGNLPFLAPYIGGFCSRSTAKGIGLLTGEGDNRYKPTRDGLKGRISTFTNFG